MEAIYAYVEGLFREGYRDAQNNVFSLDKLRTLSAMRLGVNEMWPLNGQQWSLLHYACRLGLRDLVRMLLRVPGVDPNLAAGFTLWTPLLLAVYHDHVACVVLLLQDTRVDILRTAEYAFYNRTPFAEAVVWARVPILKAFFALRDPDEMLPLASKCLPRNDSVRALISKYEKWPLKARHEFGVDMGLSTTVAAELFAVIILLGDGYLYINHRLRGDWRGSHTTLRLVKMAQKLPMELQMTLSRRAAALAGSTVLQKHLDPGLCSLLSPV